MANGQASAETGAARGAGLGEGGRSRTGGCSSILELCYHAFLAHNSSFHIGRADGPLLCSAVVITTRPQRIHICSSLMVAGGDRLVIVTARAFCAVSFTARPARKTRNWIHAAPAN